MSATFETPSSASLNRVQIIDLPGLPLEESVRGLRGDELISNRALMSLAAPYAGALGLDPTDLPPVTPQLTRSKATVRHNAALAVSRGLQSDDPSARAAAQNVATRLGRNLGWLLITLSRGDEVNRSVRPDWRAADWQQWAAIRTVWLGGGLTSGPLGEAIMTSARGLLGELGCGQPDVRLSPYRDLIALVGAARALPILPGEPAHRTVLGFDFGHTLVKRAVLHYADGALVVVVGLPSLLTEWSEIYPTEEDKAALGRRVLDFVVDVIAQTAAEQPDAEPVALVSIAAYKQNGRLVGNGPYASIHAAAGEGPAAQILSGAASQTVGRAVTVHPIHDGTAAALAHAGAPHSAVIMLGTTLGVGFPPVGVEGLHPRAGQLREANGRNIDIQRSVSGARSYAPMSQAVPCGRDTPRWSMVIKPSLQLPASMAGLPGSNAWVSVVPGALSMSRPIKDGRFRIAPLTLPVSVQPTERWTRLRPNRLTLPAQSGPMAPAWLPASNVS